MKVFATVTLLITIIYFHKVESKISVDQVKGMLSKFKGTCQKKSGASEEYIDGTHNGEFPDDPALMCYEKCVLQSMNMIKKDQINSASLIKQINAMVNENVAPKLVEMVSACTNEATSTDICEQSFQFVRCWWNIDPSLYLFP